MEINAAPFCTKSTFEGGLLPLLKTPQKEKCIFAEMRAGVRFRIDDNFDRRGLRAQKTEELHAFRRRVFTFEKLTLPLGTKDIPLMDPGSFASLFCKAWPNSSESSTGCLVST